MILPEEQPVRYTFVERAIIFTSFALTVLHLFTFAQIYYRYYYTFVLFGLLLVLNGINSKSSNFKIFREMAPLLAAAFVLFLLGVVVGTMDFKTFITPYNIYLPPIIWAFAFGCVNPILKDRGRTLYIAAILIFVFVGSVATFRVLMVDGSAARELAGAATLEDRYRYVSQGCGGFGFIYSILFLLFGALLWRKAFQSKFVRFIMLVAVAFGYVTLFVSSYSTAVLLALASFILYLYSDSKSRSNLRVLYIVVPLSLAWLFRENIFEGVVRLAQILDLPKIEERFSQLLSINSSEDSVESLRRYELYKESVDSFLKNPLFGTEKFGGHSFVFDMLGRFGLFGLFYVVALCRQFFAFLKIVDVKLWLIYPLVIAFSFVNPLEPLELVPSVFFVLPLILADVSNKERYSYE